MAAFQYAGVYGPETILDQTGALATGISVEVYQHGTSTPAQLYQPSTSGNIQTLPVPLASANYSTNPVLTDSLGNLVFWAAPGVYDLAFTIQGVQTSRTVVVRPDPAESGLVLPVLRAHLAATTATAASGAGTTIPFDAVDEDTAGGFNTSTHAYTVPSGGLYLVTAGVGLQGGSTGIINVSLAQNGSDVVDGPVSPLTGSFMTGAVTRRLRCAAGDTILASCYQTTGATQTLTSGSLRTYLEISKVAD